MENQMMIGKAPPAPAALPTLLQLWGPVLEAELRELHAAILMAKAREMNVAELLEHATALTSMLHNLSLLEAYRQVGNSQREIGERMLDEMRKVRETNERATEALVRSEPEQKHEAPVLDEDGEELGPRPCVIGGCTRPALLEDGEGWRCLEHALPQESP